jgi:hypothetical protein
MLAQDARENFREGRDQSAAHISTYLMPHPRFVALDSNIRLAQQCHLIGYIPKRKEGKKRSSYVAPFCGAIGWWSCHNNGHSVLLVRQGVLQRFELRRPWQAQVFVCKVLKPLLISEERAEIQSIALYGLTQAQAQVVSNPKRKVLAGLLLLLSTTNPST